MSSPHHPFNEALSHRFSQVLYRCLEEVGSTKGALYLAVKGEPGFQLVSHYGFPRLVTPPEYLDTGTPLLAWIQRERRTFVVNNARQYKELSVLTQGAETPRFLISPVYDKGDWVGVMVQRDRLKGELFDLTRDEAPTLAICQEIVEAVHEFQFLLALGSRPGIPEEESAKPPEQTEAIPVVVPPSDSMFPPSGSEPFGHGEMLEGFQAQGEAALSPLTRSGAYPVREDTQDKIPELPPDSVRDAHRHRPGMFLPEQRTFFWEAASLLTSIVPLSAMALWMDEPNEVRPILTYSRLPLSTELKQQILAHATYHVPKVVEKDLRIFTKAEWLDRDPLRGVFRTYLPVVLMEEGGGQDLLLLFRTDERAFSEPEQMYIQQVARMLGFHLQEGRLHEQYHRAFLSVAHRILSTVEGGSTHIRSHSLNTAKLARNFVLRLELPSTEVEAVSIAAILHDVGTFMLDPELLAKAQLTAEDMARIRTHPVLASAFLKDFRFPFDVLNIIRHHHERWDGKGYPDGLKGEEIPVGSRIINLVESFEVMSSGNEFKPPKPSREILDEIRREAGHQFDPSIVAEFIEFLASKAKRNA